MSQQDLPPVVTEDDGPPLPHDPPPPPGWVDPLEDSDLLQDPATPQAS